MSKAVERKVYASTLGAGAGTIVSEFALWGVREIWWPDYETIPTPVASFVELIVIVGFTFFAGWWAKHESDLEYSEHNV
jgi:hypothetical protein